MWRKELNPWALVVVSMLAFYSYNPSSNRAEAYSFFCNILFENNENKQKEAGNCPFLKKELNPLIHTSNNGGVVSLGRAN